MFKKLLILLFLSLTLTLQHRPSLLRVYAPYSVCLFTFFDYPTLVNWWGCFADVGWDLVAPVLGAVVSPFAYVEWDQTRMRAGQSG